MTTFTLAQARRFRRLLDNQNPRNRRRDFTRSQGMSGGRRYGYKDDLVRVDRAALQHYLRTWRFDTCDGYVEGDELLLVWGQYDPNEGSHDVDPDRAELEALAAEDPYAYCDEDFDDSYTIFNPSDPSPVNALADEFWRAHEHIDDPFSDEEDDFDEDLIWHPDFLDAIGWSSDHIRSSC